MPSNRLVAVFPLSRSAEVRVAAVTDGGYRQPRLDIRVWWWPPDKDDFVPTKKGASIALRDVPGLIEALQGLLQDAPHFGPPPEHWQASRSLSPARTRPASRDAEIFALHEAGCSQSEIARRLGIGKATVNRRLRSADRSSGTGGTPRVEPVVATDECPSLVPCSQHAG